MRARSVLAADGTLKTLATPAWVFDTDMAVAGIATNGDGYELEVEV